MPGVGTRSARAHQCSDWGSEEQVEGGMNVTVHSEQKPPQKLRKNTNEHTKLEARCRATTFDHILEDF